MQCSRCSDRCECRTRCQRGRQTEKSLFSKKPIFLKRVFKKSFFSKRASGLFHRKCFAQVWRSVHVSQRSCWRTYFHSRQTSRISLLPPSFSPFPCLQIITIFLQSFFLFFYFSIFLFPFSFLYPFPFILLLFLFIPFFLSASCPIFFLIST